MHTYTSAKPGSAVSIQQRKTDLDELDGLRADGLVASVEQSDAREHDPVKGAELGEVGKATLLCGRRGCGLHATLRAAVEVGLGEAHYRVTPRVGGEGGGGWKGSEIGGWRAARGRINTTNPNRPRDFGMPQTQRNQLEHCIATRPLCQPSKKGPSQNHADRVAIKEFAEEGQGNICCPRHCADEDNDPQRCRVDVERLHVAHM